jgi:hypothetical protein
MYLGPNKVLYRDVSITVLQLTRGKQVVIDTDCYDLVKDRRWHAKPSGRTWYANNTWDNKDGVGSMPMHRLIAGIKDPKQYVDHIDGDGLNNRRSNLRPCDNRHNIANSRRRNDNTSGFKGVHLRPNGQYQARINIDGNRKSLGHYDDPVMAAKIYDAAARHVYGEFARTNFPEQVEDKAA